MTWLQRYKVRHYFRNSIWILPVVSIGAAILVVRLLHWIETEMSWVSSVESDTVRTVLGTMASSLFTSIVFVCSALLVAVQLASAQLSPRIIGLVFRDPVTKFSLTLFVFTFTFSLGVMVRIQSTVPSLTAYVAAYGFLVNLGVFFYLIDHLGKALRPSGVLRVVSELGREVIESLYPHRLAELQEGIAPEVAQVLGEKPATMILSTIDGVVLAFDQEGLLALACRTDCIIELVPQVGDYLASGDPLFRIFQGGETIPVKALCQSIAVDQERTLEQDSTFAFRIMVDVASKALSPAINDPTTAVLALDQIHHLLRKVGDRYLDTGQVRDASGRIRLIYRTPDWEDFVRLAVTEIRHFGGESIQVARRLRGMLENLIQTLPGTRATLLRQELILLHRSAERFFAEPEDRALAEMSDFQGVGGKGEQKPRKPSVP